MIVLVSLIVLLRGFPCFHDFSHGASLHPYSNDFCTCSPHSSRKRSYAHAYDGTYAHAYMRRLARARPRAALHF